MRTHSMIRNSMFAAGLVIALAAVPTSQALAQDSGSMAMHPSSPTLSGKADDAWITTKVKSEFATTEGVDATEISVTTKKGIVWLSGHAGSAAEKAKAERVARSVKGVKGINAKKLIIGTAGDGM